jgi:sugar lactone lactonase YvrE
MNRPRALAIDGEGQLLAGCSATREVYRFNAANQPEPLTGGGIGNPIDIAVNRAGELLVSDLELHCIWKVPAAGGKAEKFVEVPAPRGLSIDADDRLWVVSHDDNTSLLRVSADKQIETIVAGGAFRFPHDVAIDKNGTAYVSDGPATTIWRIGAKGKPVAWVQGDPLKSPTSMAWQDEALLVADPIACVVFRIDADGAATALDLQ